MRVEVTPWLEMTSDESVWLEVDPEAVTVLSLEMVPLGVWMVV